MLAGFLKSKNNSHQSKTQPMKLRKRNKPVDPDVLKKDLKIIEKFTQVYCRYHHQPENQLCNECRDFLEYARTRREKCPYDPKPKCKECPTHCYKPDYRQKMREIMKFSGMYYVKRGRIDWLFKYFLSHS